VSPRARVDSSCAPLAACAARVTLVRAQSKASNSQRAPRGCVLTSERRVDGRGREIQVKMLSFLIYKKKIEAKAKIDYFSMFARPCMHRRDAQQFAYFSTQCTVSFFIAVARRAQNRSKTSEMGKITKLARLTTKALSDYFAIFFLTNTRTQAYSSNPELQRILQCTFCKPRARAPQRHRQMGALTMPHVVVETRERRAEKGTQV